MPHRTPFRGSVKRESEKRSGNEGLLGELLDEPTGPTGVGVPEVPAGVPAATASAASRRAPPVEVGRKHLDDPRSPELGVVSASEAEYPCVMRNGKKSHAELTPVTSDLEESEQEVLEAHIAKLVKAGRVIRGKRGPMPAELLRPGPRCPGASRAVTLDRRKR